MNSAQRGEQGKVMRHSLSFLFLNQPGGKYSVPCLEEGTSIPKIIHQILIHQTECTFELPLKVNRAIARMMECNPGWDHKFYNNSEIDRFIIEFYGKTVLSYYHRISPDYGAARADFFRYLLMYQVGGVYLDIKSTATRRFDEIIRPDDRLILCQWGTSPRFEGAGRHDWEFRGKIEGGELQQWNIIAAPGHPYLRRVIQSVMRNIDCYIPDMHGVGAHGVLRVTGPIAYTLAIVPLLPMNRHRLVASHEVLGLEYSVFGNNTAHNGIFKKSYKSLTTPIIQVDPARRALSTLYRAFHWARARLRTGSARLK